MFCSFASCDFNVYPSLLPSFPSVLFFFLIPPWYNDNQLRTIGWCEKQEQYLPQSLFNSTHPRHDLLADIHWHLLNIYGAQTVHLGTMRGGWCVSAVAAVSPFHSLDLLFFFKQNKNTKLIHRWFFFLCVCVFLFVVVFIWYIVDLVVNGTDL